MEVKNCHAFEVKISAKTFQASQVYIEMTVVKKVTKIPLRLLEYQNGTSNDVICETVISQGMIDFAGVELAIVRRKDAEFMEVHLIPKK